MSEQFYADNIDITGHSYRTVGENIRKGAKDVDGFISGLTDNTEIAKVTDALNVSAEELKTAIVDLLSGQRANFGGIDTEPLTTEQKEKITSYLGI